MKLIVSYFGFIISLSIVSMDQQQSSNALHEAQIKYKVITYNPNTIDIQAINNQGHEIGYSQLGPQSCRIYFLTIFRDLRRQGLGSALFNHSLKTLNQNYNCNTIYWLSRGDIVPFYLKNNAEFDTKQDQETHAQFPYRDVHMKYTFKDQKDN